VHALKARVLKGKFVIDEETDLPEGTELELLRVDELEIEEREEFVRNVKAGLDDHAHGCVFDDAGARED
jgi:hypothetical protein